MTAVEVTEQAVLGVVGRAGENLGGLSVVQQDDELVVHDLAFGDALAQTVDLRGRDRLLVGMNGRFLGVFDGVEQHLDVGGPRGDVVYSLENGGPLEFVDRDPQAESGPGYLLDEVDDGFDQPARQPVIGRLSDVAWTLVLEPAGKFPRRDGAAFEKDAVRTVRLRFGRD